MESLSTKENNKTEVESKKKLKKSKTKKLLQKGKQRKKKTNKKEADLMNRKLQMTNFISK